MSTVAPTLLTADEFAALPDLGPCELVKGRIVDMPPPKQQHGYVCANVSHVLNLWIKEHRLGRVFSNDSGVITERDPDTIRGADAAFYSYAKIPPGILPNRYPDVSPDLVIEVRSPDDRWSVIFKKVAEYLDAGVGVVCVVDPISQTVHVIRPDCVPEVIDEDHDWTLPDVLGDFRVPVRTLFE